MNMKYSKLYIIPVLVAATLVFAVSAYATFGTEGIFHLEVTTRTRSCPTGPLRR